jgi:ABC-type transport system involved in cytochrome c biogenesis permease subunit
MNAIAALHGLSLIAYLLAGARIASSLAGGHTSVPRSGVGLIGVGVITQLIGLTMFVLRFAELPLVGLAASFSTLALLIGGFLLATAVRREVRPLALVLIPLVALLLAVALTLGITPGTQANPFGGLWFVAHVVLALIGYACLALAFAAGLLYLVQFRALKGKNFGRAFRFFPALETLDKLRQRVLLAGLPALSLALLLGWAWTVRFRNSFAAENPQVIWGVVTWFVFVAALAARSGGAGAERRAAVASVGGFIIVVTAYVVLRLAMADGRAFL